MKHRLLLLFVLLASCRQTQAPPPSRPALVFPVRVAAIAMQEIQYTIAAVGSIDAYERVPITARVTGVVERVGFTEGDSIKKQQNLVDIELERYSLTVKAAEAALQRAQATLAEAEEGFKRRQDAVMQTPDVIPGEELQTWRTRVQTFSADVRQAEVALKQAQLNMRDARVPAPTDGVIQTRDVRTGQYVQPGVLLATLLRRDPLLLRFSVLDSDALHLRPDLKVQFHLRDHGRMFSASIIHVAAAADQATRMVAVTAKIADIDPILRPGAFAEIAISLPGQDTIVIPSNAIRSSERGHLVYVVQGDKVEERRITPGLRTADGQVEVRAGVHPGELLVIRGAEALHDGATVRIVEDDTTTLELGRIDP